MGLLEEPRAVIKGVCNHFYEMPETTIREHTFCCAGGAGLGTDENMEMEAAGRPAARQRGAPRPRPPPRQPARLHLRHRSGDAAPLCDYWAPGVDVSGVHELVGNALVMKRRERAHHGPEGEPLHPHAETQEPADA